LWLLSRRLADELLHMRAFFRAAAAPALSPPLSCKVVTYSHACCMGGSVKRQLKIRLTAATKSSAHL
jgi:hypothetical protein